MPSAVKLSDVMVTVTAPCFSTLKVVVFLLAGGTSENDALRLQRQPLPPPQRRRSRRRNGAGTVRIKKSLKLKNRILTISAIN